MLRCESVAPLGNPGRPRGVLDVDGVVGGELVLGHRQPLGADLVGAGHEVVPRGPADDDDVPQVRTALARLVDHREVVRPLEGRSRDEDRDAGLAQDVGQLVGAVGRVDRHEDRTDLRGGELDEDPLVAVRRPDADPVALRHARGDEAAGEAVDRRTELGPRVPDVRAAVDERVAVTEPLDGAVEAAADRLLQERGLGGPDRVGQGRLRGGGHRRPSGGGAGASANTAAPRRATGWCWGALRRASGATGGRGPRAGAPRAAPAGRRRGGR